MDSEKPKRVVVVDEDRDVAELIVGILTDEGFDVSSIYKIDQPNIADAIEKIGPDCAILDGVHLGDEWEGWEIARRLGGGPRPVPVVMLTAEIGAQEEAFAGLSDRARAAGFVSLISKPFDIDRLIATVRRAVGLDIPVGTDPEERVDREDLLARLVDTGAEELTSSRIGREWATFRVGPQRVLYKIYRWRSAELYSVGRYSLAGDRLELLGQFSDLDALMVYCADEINRGRSSPT